MVAMAAQHCECTSCYEGVLTLTNAYNHKYVYFMTIKKMNGLNAETKTETGCP